MADSCLSDVFNFSAGPAAIPETVLQRARDELLTRGTSFPSLMEVPFSSAAFRTIADQAHQRLSALLALPDNYRILFMAGGAMAQFGLLPLNLLGSSKRLAYVDSGYWASRAITEARRFATVDIVASAWRDDEGVHLPAPKSWGLETLDRGVAYCHYTANETADGAQFPELHEHSSSDVAVVCDMTSSFLARPLDVSRYGLIYAGAQKNIGPAGLTVVLVRDDLLGRSAPQTPDVFNYGLQSEARSCRNTPPTFAVGLANLVFEWIADNGGLSAMARHNDEKSAMVYRTIAESCGFYRCSVAPGSRSGINVCFTLPDEVLTERFIVEAEENGLHHLRGHSRIGGIRASFYNAVPHAAAVALSQFMKDFQARRG